MQAANKKQEHLGVKPKRLRSEDSTAWVMLLGGKPVISYWFFIGFEMIYSGQSSPTWGSEKRRVKVSEGHSLFLCYLFITKHFNQDFPVSLSATSWATFSIHLNIRSLLKEISTYASTCEIMKNTVKWKVGSSEPGCAQSHLHLMLNHLRLTSDEGALSQNREMVVTIFFVSFLPHASPNLRVTKIDSKDQASQWF